MDVELKTALDELGQAFEAFKTANEDRLKKSDAITEAAVAKANAAVDAATDRVKAIETATRERIDALEIKLNRSGLGGDGEKDLRTKAAAFSMYSKGSEAAIGHQEYAEYCKSFPHYLRKGDKAIGAEHSKGMSVGSDPDGGYWVTSDMTGRIAALIYETSPIRQIASVQTIGGDALEGPLDLGEAGSGWVGETSAITETTTPTVGKWRIPLHIQFAEPRATQSLLDDAAIDVEGWLNRKIADKLSRTENTAFVAGDGIIKPRGFLTYASGVASATTWNVIEQVNTGVSGGFHATLPGDTFIDVIFKVKAAYRNNARWVMNRTTLGAVRKIKDGDGNYMWQPSFQAGVPSSLAGYAVTEAEDMPAIAANSFSIAFGDFREGYQIVEKAGVRVLRDPFTAKPWVKFYSTKRVGGDVVNFEAIKLMKFAA